MLRHPPGIPPVLGDVAGGTMVAWPVPVLPRAGGWPVSLEMGGGGDTHNRRHPVPEVLSPAEVAGARPGRRLCQDCAGPVPDIGQARPVQPAAHLPRVRGAQTSRGGGGGAVVPSQAWGQCPCMSPGVMAGGRLGSPGSATHGTRGLPWGGAAWGAGVGVSQSGGVLGQGCPTVG